VVSAGSLGIGDATLRKGYPMRLDEWEVTIQKVTDECRRNQKRSVKVLMEWRSKLEKEPSLLKPFQIDEIIREVRRRLSSANQ
jgi:hypothetical protein